MKTTQEDTPTATTAADHARLDPSRLVEQAHRRAHQIEGFLAMHGDGIHETAALRDEASSLHQRADGGRLGRCEHCAIVIEPTILAMDPLARLCLECHTPEQRRDLERDLELAQAVQSRLLPARHAEFPAWALSSEYQPLGVVSGDFYHYAAVGSSLYVLFGDVAGKGLSASLLAAHLQALFRALVEPGRSVLDIAHSANHLFSHVTLNNAYATAVVARLEDNGELELVNAGHCPPALRRGGQVQPLLANGLPLGLFAEAEYHSHRERLEPGDLLLLYTDGVSEATNLQGDEYGHERAQRLLSRLGNPSARATSLALLADADAFRAGAPRYDDLTVLALERLGDCPEASLIAPSSTFTAKQQQEIC